MKDRPVRPFWLTERRSSRAQPPWSSIFPPGFWVLSNNHWIGPKPHTILAQTNICKAICNVTIPLYFRDESAHISILFIPLKEPYSAPPHRTRWQPCSRDHDNGLDPS